jgi:hypothetical protein
VKNHIYIDTRMEVAVPNIFSLKCSNDHHILPEFESVNSYRQPSTFGNQCLYEIPNAVAANAIMSYCQSYNFITLQTNPEVLRKSTHCELFFEDDCDTHLASDLNIYCNVEEKLEENNTNRGVQGIQTPISFGSAYVQNTIQCFGITKDTKRQCRNHRYPNTSCLKFGKVWCHHHIKQSLTFGAYIASCSIETHDLDIPMWWKEDKKHQVCAVHYNKK